MTDYFDLGNHHHPISTGSQDAQRWFDHGMVWCYGFNHEEAARCFEKTINLDPNCAMGYWGLCYARGAFYNRPWEWYGEEERAQANRSCYDHIQKARSLSSTATPQEAQLIEALAQKHQAAQADNLIQLRQWERDYADSMRSLLKQNPRDPDVICLTAEAMMNLARWKLWNIQLGIPAEGADTELIVDLLEQGLNRVSQQGSNPHPGLLHFYLHALEMSPQPEKALVEADQLRSIAPQSGHLLHMATHIDVLCGQYVEAIEANDRAIAADLAYIELHGKQEFYMISCVHNFHSKMYAAMFAGQYGTAIRAAETIQWLIDDEMLQTRDRYLRSTLEAYYSSKVHVLIRFGRWQTIVDEDPPEHPELHPITMALLYYGKSISHAALGDIGAAREYRSKLDAMHEAIPEHHIMANNPSRDILAVAAAMADGEIEYHAGNHDEGYFHLLKACGLSDSLAYAEPWPWMHPPRHALGALLLEQGHVEAAMQHYADDLGIDNRLPRCLQHRDNIWALHGYLECRNRLGLTEDLDSYRQKLELAMRHADIKIESSCCCRKTGFDPSMGEASL